MIQNIEYYKGYGIDLDTTVSTMPTYTVQFQGDDVVFETIEKAREFIDYITDKRITVKVERANGSLFEEEVRVRNGDTEKALKTYEKNLHKGDKIVDWY